ncbi:hypothetical protein ACL02T_24680 [Pseudonocardia sp. RS010]|uniref:hypothetical protein n=1 Tax=Pseudonocardia sp. RS010 TaxID=3385979 RepID=UPI0039A1C5DD
MADVRLLTARRGHQQARNLTGNPAIPLPLGRPFTAMVTGAASGIGLALAEQLRGGAELVLADVDEGGCTRRPSGSAAPEVVVDVADPADPADADRLTPLSPVRPPRRPP